MKFNEILKKLRVDAGLSQSALADLIGISRSAIGMYELGNREPDFETMETIADYFDVSMDYLHGLTGNKGKGHALVTCDECGLGYSAKSEEDYQFHQLYHQKYVNAKEKFPEVITSTKIESVKSKAYEILSLKESVFNEKYNAWVNIFKTYFSRSLSANDFNLNHVNFSEYVSMLLYQNNFKKRISADIYVELVSVFGAKQGIPEGKTVYDVPLDRDTQSISPDKLELTEGERMLLDLFNQIPEDKQQLAIEMIRAALKANE